MLGGGAICSFIGLRRQNEKSGYKCKLKQEEFLKAKEIFYQVSSTKTDS